MARTQRTPRTSTPPTLDPWGQPQQYVMPTAHEKLEHCLASFQAGALAIVTKRFPDYVPGGDDQNFLEEISGLHPRPPGVWPPGLSLDADMTAREKAREGQRVKAAAMMLLVERRLRYDLAAGDTALAVLRALDLGARAEALHLDPLAARAERAMVKEKKEHRDRTKGGEVRHGGEVGAAWRDMRATWVIEADRKARKDHPRWVQEKRWEKIAAAWNDSLESALASGHVAPVPPHVQGRLTWRNVERILETKRHTS